MICGTKASLAFRYAVCHFGLSCFVGWLAYWLTSTILLHITVSPDLMFGFSIHHCSLLVALSSSVAAHVLQDYLLNWF